MASRPGASSSSVCVGWILHLGTNAESRHIYGDRAATEASLMPLGSGTRLLPSGSVADRGGGDAEHRDVVRQVPTVGLVDDVEQAVEQAVDAGLLGQEPAGGGAERLDPEALGRVGRLQPLDQPVRVAEQGPGVADAQAHGLPGVTFLEDPEGGFADRVDDLAFAIGGQRRRRMAGRGNRISWRSGLIRRQQTVVNISSVGRSRTSTSWSPSSTSPSPWPVSVSALQAARSATPTAAPSGPCPATSPISVATVPSGSSRAS